MDNPIKTTVKIILNELDTDFEGLNKSGYLDIYEKSFIDLIFEYVHCKLFESACEKILYVFKNRHKICEIESHCNDKFNFEILSEAFLSVSPLSQLITFKIDFGSLDDHLPNPKNMVINFRQNQDSNFILVTSELFNYDENMINSIEKIENLNWLIYHLVWIIEGFEE